MVIEPEAATPLAPLAITTDPPLKFALPADIPS